MGSGSPPTVAAMGNLNSSHCFNSTLFVDCLRLRNSCLMPVIYSDAERFSSSKLEKTAHHFSNRSLQTDPHNFPVSDSKKPRGWLRDSDHTGGQAKFCRSICLTEFI